MGKFAESFRPGSKDRLSAISIGAAPRSLDRFGLKPAVGGHRNALEQTSEVQWPVRAHCAIGLSAQMCTPSGN